MEILDFVFPKKCINCKKLNIPFKNILEIICGTKTQVGQSNSNRKLNVKGEFALLNLKLEFLKQNIFLVDDVATTGSTLKEAAQKE